MPKRYLGDAVYVDFDGYYVTLTTEDGIHATNVIMLEPEVWTAVQAYVAEMMALRATMLREQDSS